MRHERWLEKRRAGHGGAIRAAWSMGLLGLFCASAALAQDARGYRGQWFGWGTGSYQAMSLDLNVWRVTLQANGNGNEFKLASGDESWSYQWSYGQLVPLAEIVTAYTWTASNSSVEAVPGRHYTFAMNNVNSGSQGLMIVQETSNAPISISSVSHEVDGGTATVTIGTSAVPSGEAIWVRYTLDNWVSSAFVDATGSGTNWVAEIVHGAGDVGLTCAYFVLTTTVAAPSHTDADLQAIRWNNNGGANYSYVVDGAAPEVPSVQASDLHFTAVSSTGATVSWTDGNGAGRLVVVRAGAAVDAVPQEGADYSASATFGVGTELGTGNFVVYSGSGSSVAVSGLAPETTCHVQVFEYNGGGEYRVYNTAPATGNPASEATLAPPPHALYLNEVLSSNSSNIQDEDGDFSDWVELYNAGPDPVSLQGWGLSDSYASPFKWVFGDVTIAPGEYLVVWASSKNRPAVTNGNQLHTSFAISAGGEEVILTHPDGTRVDELEPIAIPTDVSIGRQPDGTGPWKFFDVPTPGASNTGTGQEPGLEPPVFSAPGGMYTSTVALELSTGVDGAVVRYTTDGSEPTESSPIYSSALSLGSRAGTVNNLSEIPTNDLNPYDDYREGWLPPAGEVFKLHTIRARAFKDGSLPSAAVTQSYLVDAAGTNRYSLPVVSIATDAANFFDDQIGIYVPGWYNNMFQSGSEWERPGTIEFFEPGGALAFSGNIGIRLHGNTTRSRPRKALRIYARGPSTFDYRIFPDKPLAKFDTFILRNGGNDWGDGVIRDLYLQSLAENTSLDRQHGRPVLVFLNGEYWGIHDLRERFDDEYIERNYGLSASEFVQLETMWEEPYHSVPAYDRGNPDGAQSYADLRTFVQNNGVVSLANYDHVRDRLDVDNFIDFYQAHIFFGNTDWPGNNVRLWRSMDSNRVEGAAYRHDGRWRYMLFDADFGFGLNFKYVPGNENYEWANAFGVLADHNTLAHAASPDQTDFSNHPNATMMFRRLLENSDFREAFVTRFSDQLNTAYSRAHVTNRWAQWLAVVDPEMGEHAARWRQPYNWSAEKARIRSYGEQRTAAVWGHLQGYFGLGTPHNLTVDSDPEQGAVRVNTIGLDESTAGFEGYPWTGLYFGDFPIVLTAVPRPGHRFVEWIQASAGTTVLATDQASNYTSWANGSNEGSGFGAWSLIASSGTESSGFFLDQGRGGWGVYANNGQQAAARRPFNSALAVGQTFSVRLDHGSIANGGSVGVALMNEANEDLLTFGFTGGQSEYRINDANTGIGFTTDSIDVEITLATASTYSARITPAGRSSTVLVGSLQARADLDIRRFEGWNYSAGSGAGADVFYNLLQISELAGGGEPVSYSTNATIEVSLSGATTFEAVFELLDQPAAELIHYWNFNDTATLLAPTYSVVAGAGISVAPGPITVVTSGTLQDFAGENARFDDPAGAHLRVNDPIGAAMDVAMPTTGFEDVVVKYETRRSGSGAGSQVVSYTLDGSAYIPLATVVVTEIPTVISFDFAEISGADHNPAFGLRIEFAQGGGGTVGNNRFDNWTVEGLALELENSPPFLLAPIGAQSLVEGTDPALIDLSGVFGDADGDALSFAVERSNPHVASATVAGGTLTLAPLLRGEVTITLSADDGHNDPVSTSFRVLVYPEAHVLENGNVEFREWASTEPAGAYPANMIFLQSDQNDTQIDTPLVHAYHIPLADASAPIDADYPYAATARSRLNGLGEDGIAFINTGRGRDLGGALLALDTRNVAVAPVSWLGGTVLANTRVYAIRLQYRVGTTGEFLDVLDGEGQPVEYVRSTTGHSQPMGPALLPAAALGQDYVQVLWRYYWTDPLGATGARAQLRLDDIRVANNAAAPAVALEFGIEPPAYALSGAVLPVFSVRAVDGEGLADLNFAGTVSLSLASGPGALSGTTTVAAAGGVATFGSVAITGTGPHTLRATSGSLTQANSQVIAVDAVPVFIPGGSAVWNLDDHWTSAAYPNAIGGAAKILAPASANRAVTLSAPVTVGALTADNGDSPYRNRINGASALTFAVESDNARLAIKGDGTGFVEFEVTGGVVLASDLEIDVANIVGDAEYGALRLRQGWSGPGGITKSGAGMASLTGDAKTFTGPIVVEQGVLAFSQPSSPASSSGTTVQPGGQVRLTSANDEFGARIYSFGGTLSLSGSGRSGVPEGEALGVLGALRYEPGAATNRAVVAGPVQIAAPAGIHVAHESNEMELAGALSGSAALSKSGGGTLILSGAGSAYSGEIDIETGGLLVSAAIPASAVVVKNGTFVGGTGSIGGDLHFEAGAALVFDPAGPLGVGGTATFGGFGIADLIGLDADTPVGSYAFINGNASTLNVANLGAPNAVPLGDSGKTAYFTAAMELVVQGGEAPTGYEAWQQDEFTPAEQADPATSGPLADPGGSGVPNLLRYGLGMGRSDAYIDFRPTGDMQLGPGGTFRAVYRHRRLLALDSGIEYIIEATYDLMAGGAWPEAVLDVDLVELGSVATGDGITETAEYGIVSDGLADPRFFRLRIRMIE